MIAALDVHLLRDFLHIGKGIGHVDFRVPDASQWLVRKLALSNFRTLHCLGTGTTTSATANHDLGIRR